MLPKVNIIHMVIGHGHWPVGEEAEQLLQSRLLAYLIVCSFLCEYWMHMHYKSDSYCYYWTSLWNATLRTFVDIDNLHFYCLSTFGKDYVWLWYCHYIQNSTKLSPLSWISFSLPQSQPAAAPWYKHLETTLMQLRMIEQSSSANNILTQAVKRWVIDPPITVKWNLEFQNWYRYGISILEISRNLFSTKMEFMYSYWMYDLYTVLCTNAAIILLTMKRRSLYFDTSYIYMNMPALALQHCMYHLVQVLAAMS